MKNILVVCNNPPEWKHFVDVTTWNLSKQNKPYKLYGDVLFDVQNNQEFIHVPNNMYRLSEKLYTLGSDLRVDLIIPMCNIDKEVGDYLELFMRREE